MNVQEWQDRLLVTFSSNNLVSQRLLNIINQEKNYGDYVNNTFYGHMVITESFFDFYIETLELALIRPKALVPKTAKYYWSILLYYITNFRSLRAAVNLLMCGYLLDGYSLLRDLKDRAIFMAAIINGITSFPSIAGFSSGKGESKNLEDIRKAREKEGHRILNLMLRKESGLEESHLKQLQQWERLFHDEVHGSWHTFVSEFVSEIAKGNPIQISPKPQIKSLALYINRSTEIDWMLLRTVPFLQLAPHEFGKEWAKKWTILDESFRFMETELGALNKDIAFSIIYFIENKFNFSPALAYIER